jgi:hypothetical protein
MDLSLANAPGIATVLVAALTYLGTSRRDPAIRRRADLVETFNSEFHRSEDIYGLFADIELDRSVFPEGRTSWLSADPERTVVHLLDLFNSLGLNWYRGVISIKDIQGTTMGCAMLRAFESAEMREVSRVRASA